MIKERKPMALYEVEEMLGELKETDKTKDVKIFVKKFSPLNAEKSRKLRKALEDLDLIKLKESDIIKIVDLLPENIIEVNKIFTETSLDTDEINKILETIKSSK